MLNFRRLFMKAELFMIHLMHNKWSGSRIITIRLLVLIALKMDYEKVKIKLKLPGKILYHLSGILAGKTKSKEVPNKGDIKRNVCLEVQ